MTKLYKKYKKNIFYHGGVVFTIKHYFAKKFSIIKIKCHAVTYYPKFMIKSLMTNTIKKDGLELQSNIDNYNNFIISKADFIVKELKEKGLVNGE